MKSSGSWDIKPRSPLKVNRLSEGYIASIFRIKERDRQEASMKKVAVSVSTLKMEGLYFPETSIDIELFTECVKVLHIISLVYFEYTFHVTYIPYH
jgi:hypothetical protein